MIIWYYCQRSRFKPSSVVLYTITEGEFRNSLSVLGVAKTTGLLALHIEAAVTEVLQSTSVSIESGH